MAKTFFVRVQNLVCWYLLLCRSHLDVVSTNIGNIEVAPRVSGFLPKVFLRSKNCDNIKYLLEKLSTPHERTGKTEEKIAPFMSPINT